MVLMVDKKAYHSYLGAKNTLFGLDPNAWTLVPVVDVITKGWKACLDATRKKGIFIAPN